MLGGSQQGCVKLGTFDRLLLSSAFTWCLVSTMDREAKLCFPLVSMAGILLLGVLALPGPNICDAAPLNSATSLKDEGDRMTPGSGLTSVVHPQGSGDPTSGFHSGSSGDDITEKDTGRSGDSNPESKGSGFSQDSKETSGEAVVDGVPEDANERGVTSVELVVENVDDNDMLTIAPNETKTTNEIAEGHLKESSGGEAVSGGVPDPSRGSSDTTKETRTTKRSAEDPLQEPSGEDSVSEVMPDPSSGTSDTTMDLKVSESHEQILLEESLLEATTTRYHSGQGAADSVDDVTSEGEALPSVTMAVYTFDDFTSSSQKLSAGPEMFTSLKEESSGTDSAVPTLTESEMTNEITFSVPEPTREALTSQTEDRPLFYTTESKTIEITDGSTEERVTRVGTLNVQFTSAHDDFKQEKRSTAFSSPSGEATETADIDTDTSSDRMTTHEDEVAVYTTKTDADVASAAESQNTYQTTEERTSVAPSVGERLTTEEEKFTTLEEERKSPEYTFSDVSKFTWQTLADGRASSSLRTRRETYYTDADSYRTTTSDANYVTHLKTDDTTYVMSSPDDVTTSAVKTTTPASTHSAESSVVPLTTMTSPEESPTTATTTTSSTTTTTTPTTTTTTARPQPSKLGDSCIPGELCVSVRNSECIDNTCACKETYHAWRRTDYCYKDPYNLTLTASGTYVSVSWKGDTRGFHDVSAISLDNPRENKTKTSVGAHEWMGGFWMGGFIPGSMVKVTVQYHTRSVSSNVTLKPRTPEALQIADVNETCVRVTWSKGKSYVDEFLVNITGRDLQRTNRIEMEGWTECGLTPGGRYSVDVYADRNSVLSKTSGHVSFTTVPSRPVNGSANPTERDPTRCVDLTWSAGEGEAKEFIVSRQVNGTAVVHVANVPADEQEHVYEKQICDGLLPGSHYTFLIESSVERGRRNTPLKVNACTVPEQVQKFKIVNLAATSVTLRWQKPLYGNTDGYVLAWQEDGQGQMQRRNITDVSRGVFKEKIDGLKPGTLYTFSVHTYFCDLLGEIQTVDNTTKLGEISNVKVLPNGTKLEISWKIPDDLSRTDDFHILLEVSMQRSGYGIYSHNVTSSFKTVDTNRSGECFVISITVVKDDITGSPYVTFASTDETAPEKVNWLHAERLADDRTVMNVTWSAPDVTNGVIRKYYVTVTGQRGIAQANRTLECSSECVLSCDASVGQSLQKRDTSTLHFHGTQDQFSVSVDHLSPYENYDVSVVAFTSAGPGLPSRFVVTDQLPATVRNLVTDASNASCVRLSWEYPENANASTVKRFSIQHVKVDGGVDPLQVNTSSLTELVCQLEFWTEYEFNISVFNQEGEGEVETKRQRTAEHAPGDVQNLTVNPESDVHKPRTISVEWSEPLNKYGNILAYFVVVEDSSGTVVADKKVTPSGSPRFSVVMDKLSAETNYTVQVFGATSAGNGTSIPQDTRISPGVLPRPQKGVTVRPSAPEAGLGDPTSTVPVDLPAALLCDRSYGHATESGLIVGRTSWNQLAEHSTQGSTPLVQRSWKEVDHDSENAAYFVHVPADTKCQSSAGEFIRVVVGSEGDCRNFPGFCNGKLQPDTDYRFQAVFCTLAGCTYSTMSAPYRTERAPVTERESGTAGVAAGVSVAFLIIFLGSGAAFYFVRRRKRSHARPDPTPEEDDMVEICRNRPVKLDYFPEHVKNLHRDSNLGFAEEYKLLKDISREYSTRAAELPACKPKNRYTNILPWDHSRVKLLPTDDEEGSDYINANYLPGEKHQREFIAAQGPLPATVDDFWRMVWENRVTIIVMLTQCVEKGKVKCEKYWPEEGESVYHGDLCVHVRSQSVLPDYIIRVIDINLGPQTRMIKHFHFMRWPDHGCPEAPAMLLNFVSAVRAHMPHSGSGPTLVHCSAGVGRTGTFIALDQLLQQIRRQTEVDIFSLVLKMRDHRIHMVQTENQYIYIHDCLVDALTTDSDEESEASDAEDEHIYGNC